MQSPLQMFPLLYFIKYMTLTWNKITNKIKSIYSKVDENILKKFSIYERN
jgi:hypothetical protein